MRRDLNAPLSIGAFLLACSPAVAAPDICLTQKAVANGELCTIRPSYTDPMIQDTGDTAHGFGDHVIAIPAEPNGKLWVHFAGSGGKPYLPQPMRYLNEQWLTELMGQGYTVVDLAYDSEFSITEACKGVDPPLNNCAGAARLEVLTGLDTSPVRNVSVANSIVHRLSALLKYLDDAEFPLPDGAFPFEDWEQYSVSGHSQGAGHAYYLAKNYGVVYACYLGGPYDVPDPIPRTRPPAKYIADWYLDDTYAKTDIDNMGAFLTVDDDAYKQFTFAYGLIGLEKGEHWFEVDKRKYTNDVGDEVNGHAAAVQDPSLAENRAQACF